jgi:hypothetical protein
VVSYQVQPNLYGNLATVTATASGGQTVTARDANYHLGTAPALLVKKAINGIYADTAPGVYLPVGTPVVWTYKVLANGDDLQIALTSFQDDSGTPGTPSDDFRPLYVSGDTNANGLLDSGEVWIFTSEGVETYTVQSGQYSNTATAAGTDQGTGTATAATGTNYHFGVASEVRVKTAVNAVSPNSPTVAEDADFAPGRILDVGTMVTWTYQVFNDGNVPLNITSLRDDAGTPDDPGDDFTPQYLSGDINGDGLLDTHEMWLFMSEDLVKAGQHTSITRLAVLDPAGQTRTSSDPANHFGNVPGIIQILKFVNGSDANTAPGLTLPIGAPVTFTYTVTNIDPQQRPLSNILVVDDNGTPSMPGDDFFAPYLSGDNGNGLLDPDEVWLFTSTGAVYVATGQPVPSFTAQPGQYTNSGQAQGTVVGGEPPLTVMATDPANYFGSAPGVKIVKAMNATDSSNPTAIEDANAAPGPAFVSGTIVVWTYQVINTGNVPLSITSLTDDNGTSNTSSDDFSPVYVSGDDGNHLLDPGEVWLFTSQGVTTYTVKTGQFSNLGTINVIVPSTGQMVSASDVNYHWGQSKGEGLTPGFWKNNADDFNAVAWPRDASGALIYSPDQTFGSVFDVPAHPSLAELTLSEALNVSGNAGVNALVRHAVAGLLSATHPRVAYPLTSRQVIDQVDAALASGDANQIESLKNTLDKHNNLDSDLDRHGNTSGPQFAAAAPTGPPVEGNPLTEEELAPILAEALARWSAAGAVLTATNFDIAIVDLPDGSAVQPPLLGYTSGTTILIDIDAGGFGWFIDPTPSDDAEFHHRFDAFGLGATAASPAVGRMDLLTVVMHELGHVLGLQSLEPGESPRNLMAPTLPAGTRRLPGPAGFAQQQAVDAAFRVEDQYPPVASEADEPAGSVTSLAMSLDEELMDLLLKELVQSPRNLTAPTLPAGTRHYDRGSG